MHDASNLYGVHLLMGFLSEWFGMEWPAFEFLLFHLVLYCMYFGCYLAAGCSLRPKGVLRHNL
jgi:hypothetical protein